MAWHPGLCLLFFLQGLAVVIVWYVVKPPKKRMVHLAVGIIGALAGWFLLGSAQALISLKNRKVLQQLRKEGEVPWDFFLTRMFDDEYFPLTFFGLLFIGLGACVIGIAVFSRKAPPVDVRESELV